ncbi:general secretion pathway protein E [Synechocystis sp. PCC 6803]|jgi:type IV pilus assembly protein PilB|uniref:General secretion pathway protein E n=1 Tax=Synechocystis sp. (strain ATCC 27184 / PCC 6803 / Kazusa) TaxID=1111708 RepID=Q55155_SYNY3|nr:MULTISPECIES: GspE/PulE family protein [unclassified Synechocystis]BAM54358.1 general secretion pathway protein E [Synechocystis sp. PCC 6803] [Bacillus subtilis BEST7613]AGF52584.1 general secretion pathway protein E [Synechocystis sp. PCC 6803]ALJ68508.1 general secretion pathway protein GspE [Synechocystis sp. PCC 6803]AVP90353.1 type II/IV secretion system protein [Synechocystis sp. IPPAS B-1465]MBD2616911.1 type II/IV secretion system protein [Synechocystis sp. FACHB-898]
MTSSSSSKKSRAVALRNYFSPFGNKLVAGGHVDAEQLRQALVQVKKTGRSLPEELKAVTGRELSPELLRQYKKNQLFELKVLYGVDSVDPEVAPIATQQMAELIGRFFPLDTCRRFKFLPLAQQEGDPPSVLVAMVDPDNLAAQDELNRILRVKGFELRRLVVTQDDFNQLLEQYYAIREEWEAAQEKRDQERALDKLNDLTDIVGSIDMNLGEDKEDVDNALDSNDANQAPVINLVNKILAKALQEGTSDIHVEPQEETLRIRFRKDGVLNQAFDPLPRKITPAVVARFKIMADMDIAERRSPQDGKIRRIYQGRKVDFRVNTLPSRYGEKVCLRILDNSATQLGLDFLITNPETLQTVRELAARPYGLMLVTGPTGSGKSTTLYSVLAERNSPEVNINTAEDPIEYALPGITQVQVIREKGMDFSNILRAFMRQDPDVILVGETRDKETAKTAIEAALTGHLVLTTLHTNDAAGAIARLDEMGVEPFMVSGSLLGVLAQRLMRKVCTECRIAYHPSKEELSRFGLSASGDEVVTFYKANSLSPDEIHLARQKGNLCQKCSGSGYKGRVGVYEVMRNSERIAELINQGATTDRIKDCAVEEGMITLLAYSLNLVQEGYTTLEEVERVTFTDTGLESEMRAKRKSALTCRTCAAELQQEWLDCPYCMTSRFS